MPMTRDEHELLLNDLNNPETDHTRRTEILQGLRTDYTSVHTDFDELTTTGEKLQKDNNDLIVSNSKLFRQVGIVGNEEKENEVDEKEFSETVSIEKFENK